MLFGITCPHLMMRCSLEALAYLVEFMLLLLCKRCWAFVPWVRVHDSSRLLSFCMFVLSIHGSFDLLDK